MMTSIDFVKYGVEWSPWARCALPQPLRWWSSSASRPSVAPGSRIGRPDLGEHGSSGTAGDLLRDLRALGDAYLNPERASAVAAFARQDGMPMPGGPVMDMESW
jgi:hypothetical protein